MKNNQRKSSDATAKVAKSSKRRPPAKTGRKQVPAVAEPPAPTPRMMKAYESADAIYTALPHRPKVEISNTSPGAVRMTFTTSEECHLAAVALGSQSDASVERRLVELVNLSKQGEQSETREVNDALAFVSAVAPRNEIEAALAVQLYGAHQMAYEMMIRAKRATMLPQVQTYSNLAVKFQRTLGEIFERLEKSRRGGEQVVRHIHVNANQAIVADTVTYGAQRNGRTWGQSHEATGAGATGAGAALPRPDTARNGVPIASDAERAVQDSRRQSAGGAEGQ